MKLNNFDEKLEIALREYVQNTEITVNEKVKFSKKHKQKMKKLFEDVKNYDFEKIAASDTKGNAYQFNVRKFARVAVFIILALLITIMVTPSMVAWRKEELSLYGGESGEYSWILPDDITEILENNGESVRGEDLTFFGYLPEKSVVKTQEIVRNCYYTKIKVDDKEIMFKVLCNSDRAIDIENTTEEKITIKEKEIFILEKDDVYSFIWYCDEKNYNLMGNLNKNDMIKIIENINYEKIEEIFIKNS